MKNPFRLFWFALKARSPRRIDEMRTAEDNFWLGDNYAAMMFFGTIIAHKGSLHTINGRVRRHETIHLRQAQAMHNSWLCYYTLYIWYYLRALPQNRKRHNAAYYINPFELEAYEHENDIEYIAQCRKDGAQGWRKYAKMKPKERLALI